MSFYFFSGSLDWILVNNNVRPPDLIQDGLRSQKFVVLDLKPKTNYILRITAHNSAGSTVKEFSFTTLNSDGTPLASEGLKKDHHSEFVLPIVLVAFTITSIVLGTRLLFILFKEMLKEENHVKEASEAAEAKHVEAGSSAQKSASFVYCRQSTATKSCQFGL